MNYPADREKRKSVLAVLVLVALILMPPPGAAFVIDPKTLIGTLTVNTQPPGAEVTIDGTDYGQTPLTTALQVGTHSVRVTKTGYADVIRQVEITADSPTTVSYVLIATVSKGTLVIDSTPRGATIFIDSVAKGTTPATVPDFKPGTYAITLRLSGYEEVTEMVNIVAGQTTRFAPVLKPAQATTGSLMLGSTPSGAQVYLDDTFRGTTPVTISGLSAGSHSLVLTRVGYVEYSAPVVITAGRSSSLAVPLYPVITVTETETGTAGTGSISISTTPAGATVYLDEEQKGKSPVTLSGVPDGAHTVRLVLSGYQDDAAAVTVITGQVARVTVTMKKSDENPGKGRISVTSEPAGATVFLNLQESGTTPLSLTEITPGTYEVMVSADGYESWQQTISVTDSRTTTVSAVLSKSSGGESSGSLMVTSVPSGSSVWLDGTPRGQTPLIIPSPPAGSHTLTLEKEGYEKFETTVVVTGGKEQQFAASLIPVKTPGKLPGFAPLCAFIALAVVFVLKRKGGKIP